MLEADFLHFRHIMHFPPAIRAAGDNIRACGTPFNPPWLCPTHMSKYEKPFSPSRETEIHHIFVEFITNKVLFFECLAISMPVYYAAAQQQYHHAPQKGRGRGRGEKGGNRAGGKGVCMRTRKGARSRMPGRVCQGLIYATPPSLPNPCLGIRFQWEMIFSKEGGCRRRQRGGEEPFKPWRGEGDCRWTRGWKKNRPY